jgi:hypothetical protein
MNAYTRPRKWPPTKADFERARRALMDEVDRLNANWRAQPRQWRRIDDDQFDVEREADQQGISVRNYLRGW